MGGRRFVESLYQALFALPAGMSFTKRKENRAWSQVTFNVAFPLFKQVPFAIIKHTGYKQSQMLWPLPLFCVIAMNRVWFSDVLSSCLFSKCRTEVMAFNFAYFLKFFSRHLLPFFRVVRQSWQCVRDQNTAEQRILNGTAPSSSLWLFPIF